MLRLAAEGLVVAVLVLAGLVQSLRLISWRDWGIEIEHLRGEQGPHCGEAKTRGKVTGSLGESPLLIISWTWLLHYKPIQLQYDERALKVYESNS